MRTPRFALDTRIATVALAFVLAMAALPTMSGWAIVDAHCAITMDICHTVPSTDVSHAGLLGLAPQLPAATYPRDSIRLNSDGCLSPISRDAERPDLPPPKFLA